MKPAHWDALLFDLDGTLADSVELILTCFRYTMQTHLQEVPGDELWLAGMGTPLVTQLAAFARSAGELAAMQDTYRTYQRTVHDDMVRPYPRVAEVLAQLTAAKVRLGVVTSKHREMTLRTLRVCRIVEHFEVIITPEDVSRGKPDPEPVTTALARMPDVRPDRVLFVGDAPVDVQAGRAAGVRTAGALWGPFGYDKLSAARPDFLLRDIAELLHVLPNGA